MRNTIQKIVLSLSILMLATGINAQITNVSFQPDATAGIDAMISDYVNGGTDYRTQNFGTFATIDALRTSSGGVWFLRRGTVYFDVSSIPTNAVVTSATLTLYGISHNNTNSNASYLQRLNASWTEGGITWNNQPSSTSTGQISLAASTSSTQDYALSVTSHIQDMVTNPSTNYGWILKLQSETGNNARSLQFGSSDNATSAKRPKLEVSYYLPLSATGTQTDMSCQYSTLCAVDITPADGVPPYTYSWTPGAYTTQDVSNLAPGLYTVTITDSYANTTTVSKELAYNVQWTNLNNMTVSSYELIQNYGGNNWSNGAASTNEIKNTEDGWVEYKASNSNTHKIFGLADVDAGAGYTDIDYGLYLKNDGSFYRMNNGSQSSSLGSYSTNDVFRIERVGTTIYYKKNGTVVSAATVTGITLTPLHVEAAIWSNAAKLENVKTNLPLPYDQSCSELFLNSTENYVYSVTYGDVNTVVSESIQYSDGLGRSKQSQSRNMAENTVITAQPVYDIYGRPALQTLPAPTGRYMGYQPGFMTVSTGGIYTHANFDGASKLNSPDAVQTTVPATLGNYYSDNGPEGFVATTTYPYVRAEFTADPSSSGKRNANAGNYHKMGSGHETQSYTMVSGDELRYIFGTDKSYKSSIDASDKLVNSSITITGGIQALKTVSIDADGRETVVYTADGKTIATCYSDKSTACTMSSVSNAMQYYGTKSVDIHISRVNNSSLTLPLPTYNIASPPYSETVAHADISYVITDLKTNTVLTAGTHYSINSSTRAVTFSGAYANVSLYLRVRFAYTDYVLGLIEGTVPDAKVTYALDYTQWAVNLYDLAGRMRKEVSPKGADCASAGTYSMYTTFDYDQYGNLIGHKSPDEGKKEFTYNQEQQLRFSQNETQRTNNKYAYICYDRFGRPIESGESGISSSGKFFQNYYGSYTQPGGCSSCSTTVSIINNIGNTGLISGDLAEQIYTYYGTLASGDEIPSGYTYKTQYKQKYVHGAVTKTKNATNETWYGYDQFGRSVFTVQQIKDADFTGVNTTADKQVKTIDYIYNKASGVLTQQIYQKNQTSSPDEYLSHFYTYDAGLRLQKSEIALSDAVKKLQEKYYYYKTGALKRRELGDNVQGVDYVYTLQWQLKSINHPSLDNTIDPGHDSQSGTLNSAFAGDVFGLTLDYNPNDYSRTGTSITTSSSSTGTYNGLIDAQRYRIKNSTNSVTNGADYVAYGTGYQVQMLTAGTHECMYRYVYDEYQRLSTSTYGVFNTSGSTFTARAYNEFREWGGSAGGGIDYDKNGNITSLKRNGYSRSGAVSMDDFSYTYTSNTNKLASISDAVTAQNYSDFITNGTGTNFTYNTIGQMTVSAPESVTGVSYYMRGKVKRTDHSGGAYVEYTYNDRDIKCKAKFYNGSGTTTTWYVSDVKGNVLSTYEQTTGGGAITLKTQIIYGSGRTGNITRSDNRVYHEITDHLGNVRVTVTKVSSQTEISSWSDYYAFGGQMPGRSYQSGYAANEAKYQGQREAQNTKWDNFELRMFNNDIGRWMAPDPYAQFYSPYNGMGNNPVSMIDPNGGYAEFGKPLPGMKLREEGVDPMGAFKQAAWKIITKHGGRAPTNAESWGVGDYLSLTYVDGGIGNEIIADKLKELAMQHGLMFGGNENIDDTFKKYGDPMYTQQSAMPVDWDMLYASLAIRKQGEAALAKSRTEAAFRAEVDMFAAGVIGISGASFNEHGLAFQPGATYYQAVGDQHPISDGPSTAGGELYACNNCNSGEVLAAATVATVSTSGAPPLAIAIGVTGAAIASVMYLTETHTTYQPPSLNPIHQPRNAMSSNDNNFNPNGNVPGWVKWVAGTAAAGSAAYEYYDHVNNQPPLPVKANNPPYIGPPVKK